MAKFEVVMPKMGESVIEATITKWLKQVGEEIEEDEPIVEIATDKVDSEIPAPVEGKVAELMFEEGDVVAVGKIIAVIETDDDEEQTDTDSTEEEKAPEEKPAEEAKEMPKAEKADQAKTDEAKPADFSESNRFYSPLVKSIAREENISLDELESIEGSGKEGRVTKKDVLNYLENRPAEGTAPSKAKAPVTTQKPDVVRESGDEVFEMDRMRKLIADHMVMSKQVSPHVTSFIDVDVTDIVNWRNKVKDKFLEREKTKLTFTPIFMEAAALALKEYPRVNGSVDGTTIIHRKRINIGMATALPNGNLIVPVIKDADKKNLLGLAKDVNDLADRARNNELLPDEIQGGTFTVTNFGTFDSLTGTPIINQPQVAILGIGAIRKKPVVMETKAGDVIAIRHIMILSLAYDHRIVDGALGGMYLRRLKEILENWDTERKV